jgi:hypothetical protein
MREAMGVQKASHFIVWDCARKEAEKNLAVRRTTQAEQHMLGSSSSKNKRRPMRL